MALVNYSDSETSDVEEAPAKSAPPSAKPGGPSVNARAALPGTFERPEQGKGSGTRRIKVDLPTAQPEAQPNSPEPPVKRARTAGAFSGFNGLLPAPKRTGAEAHAKGGLQKGVSLKTSSEAAFSRRPVVLEETSGEDAGYDGAEQEKRNGGDDHDVPRNTEERAIPTAEEPKVVGKVTRFKPLSVQANRKKSGKKQNPSKEESRTDGSIALQPAVEVKRQELTSIEPPPPKPKRSLFTVHTEQLDKPAEIATTSYNSTLPDDDEYPEDTDLSTTQAQPTTGTASAESNSLGSLVSDLNLTPAQRRQLFGRNAKDANVNIAHFNMDSEYAANEQARQAGEVVEHRAVKSIAPGKHSLQQLVNNARSQRDGLEDKWADDRGKRGEGGAKYS